MNKLDIGNLPIWLGSQKTSRIEVVPFGFEVGERGLIRMANQQIIARMVEGYADNEYHFITSPPGASDWGNVLAGKSLSGLQKTYGDLQGKRILEIGGGTLYSAEFLVQQCRAAHVTVVDPALKQVSRDPRVTIVSDYYSAEMRFAAQFDLIISFNTLEHVRDPLGFLSAIRSNLAENARLYLKLPDSGNSLAIGDLGLCVHEHLSYFTAESLDVCLQAVGLERVAHANYPGALQILAQKSEPDASAHSSTSATLLSSFATRYKGHLQALDHQIESTGFKSVGFVGASVGLCNVLYLNRLHERLKVGIFDNDSLKHGEYLPGIDTPIQEPTEETLAVYDALFIAPVNFFEEIKDGLRAGNRLVGKPILPVFELR